MKNTISRIRRNHGVEHATLHILAQRYPYTPIAGHSDHQGFWIVGNLPLEAVTQAAREALLRLKAGQRHLAIHPNCGTNFVASGIFAGLAAWLALAGSGSSFRQRAERLPMAAALATMALILFRPLGSLLQERLTTSGDPGDMEIAIVCTARRGRMTAYRVTTQG